MIHFGEVEIDPIALGSQGNAILGIRDSGKTYTAMLLAEHLMEAGIPIFAFDPVGVWRFLRVPGAGRGYPVVVAGGKEGDLPLTAESVPALVEAAMKSGVSLIFDLFDINLSKADWRRIVMAALRTLLHENHQYGLRHVFIEEAAEFAPQKVMDGHVYAEMEKLARMGGNSRLGYTLINQRSEEVNKALLELCDNLFLHRQKGRNSLTALSKWLDIGNVTDAKKIVGTLSTLPTGECWAWLQGSDVPALVKVPAKNSLHPDRRVMRGDSEAPVAKPVDVGQFVAAMKKQLAAPAEESTPAAVKGGITPKQLRDAVAAADKAGYDRGLDEGKLIGRSRAFGEAIATLTQMAHVDSPESKAALTAPAAIPALPREAPNPTREIRSQAYRGEVIVGKVGMGAHGKVLQALAWWKAAGFPAIDRRRACIMAGYSPKASTFGVYISQLLAAEMVEIPEPGHLSLTAKGEAEAPEPTFNGSVVDAARDLLNPAEARVFNAVVDAHPESISRHDLADAVGLSRTASTLGVYISKVAGFGFVETGRGTVRAADWLFPRITKKRRSA